jgi:hypothetical protein
MRLPIYVCLHIQSVQTWQVLGTVQRYIGTFILEYIMYVGMYLDVLEGRVSGCDQVFTPCD